MRPTAVLAAALAAVALTAAPAAAHNAPNPTDPAPHVIPCPGHNPLLRLACVTPAPTRPPLHGR